MYSKLKKIKISDTYKKKSLNYSSYYIQCFLRYYDHAVCKSLQNQLHLHEDG